MIHNYSPRIAPKESILPKLSTIIISDFVLKNALARPHRYEIRDAELRGFMLRVNRNGTKDIFMNTPNQAAWFERYLTDWTGPKGRMGRIRFRMKDSVFPSDTMVFAGSVSEVDREGGWVDLEMELTVGGNVVTGCTARVALPKDEDDNPWKRKGDDWRP